MDQQANQLSQTSTCDKPETKDGCLDATLPIYSKKPVQQADGPSAANLPEPPEEPLQSDCCGTGCSPCVFDIYQEDLARWEELASLTPEQRAARLQNPVPKTGSVNARSALSPHEYRMFEVVAIERVSGDSFLYTFRLPEDCILGTTIGQHAVLR